jgi:hypothetical protein
MKKAYLNYKKYCEEEGYNAFRSKIFILRFGSVVNKLTTTKITLIISIISLKKASK